MTDRDAEIAQRLAELDRFGLSPATSSPAQEPLRDDEGVHPLPSRWRARGADLAAHGAGDVATVYRKCADEYERWLEAYARTPIPVAQAAQECGYSARQLRRYIRKGRLHNFGSEDRYLVRRCDLPHKPRGPASGGRGGHVSATALFPSVE